MAADYSSFDAGTGYLKVEGVLADGFRTKLAEDLATVPSMPVKVHADLDHFFTDLEQRWGQEAARHPLPVQITPQIEGRALEDALPDSRELRALLNFDEADAQLREFYSLIPIYRIPVDLDTAAARTELEALRREAEREIRIPVAPVDSTGRRPTRDTPQPPPLPSGSSAPSPAPSAPGRGSRGTTVQPPTRVWEPSVPLPGTRPDPAAEAARARQAAQEAGRAYSEAASRAQRLSQTAISHPDPAASAAAAAAAANAERAGRAYQSATREAEKLQAALDKTPSGLSGIIGSVSGLAKKLLEPIETVEKLHSDLTKLGSIAIKPITIPIHIESDVLGRFTKAGGILGLIGAGLAGIGGAGVLAGVGALGAMHLGDAFSAKKDLTAEQNNPRFQEELAMQRAAAANSLREAYVGLSDAQFRVTQAQDAAVLSQRSLSDAYRDATREVRDQKDALIDAELSQEGSALAVARARQRLLEARANPASTSLDIQEDALALRVAQQRYKESKNKTADQRVDTAISNQRGVDNSTAVLQATKANAEAQHEVVAALNGVVQAEFQVTQAAAALHRAMGPTESENKLNMMLAKLSTNARDFYDQVTALGPQWKDLQKSVSNSLFDGLGESLTRLANDQFPAFKSGLSQIASGVGSGLKDMFADLDDLFTRLETNGTAAKFIDGITQMMSALGPVVSGVTELFVNLIAQVGPSLGQFFTTFGQSLAQLNLGGLASSLVTALTPLLPVVVNIINSLASAMEPVMPILGQLAATLGQALADAITALAPALPPIATAFSEIATALAPLVPVLADLASTILSTLADTLADLARAMTPVIKAFAEGMQPVLPIITDAIKQLEPSFAKLADQLGQALLDALQQLMPHLPTLVSAFSDLVISVVNSNLVPDLINLATVALPPLAWIVGQMADLWSKLAEGVAKFLDKITDLKRMVENGLTSTIDKLTAPFKVLFHAEGGPVETTDARVPHHADGGPTTGTGLISGPGGARTDSILSFVSDGEFIVNAAATGLWGPLLAAINNGSANHLLPLLHQLLAGQVPGFMDGGAVGTGGGGLPSNDKVHAQNDSYTARPADKAATPAAVTPVPATGADGWGGSGGPVNALNYAKSHTVPYLYGGTSLAGIDCSAWVSWMQQIATGTSDPSGRIGTTITLLGGQWPGVINGASANDEFVIGANEGHMVAQINGVNVESTPPQTRYGSAATSPFSSQFTTRVHVDPSLFKPAYSPATAAKGGDGTGGDGTGKDSLASQPDANFDDKTNLQAGQSVADVTKDIPSTWSGWAKSQTQLQLKRWLFGDAAAADNSTTDLNTKTDSMADSNGVPGHDGLMGDITRATNNFAGWAHPDLAKTAVTKGLGNFASALADGASEMVGDVLNVFKVPDELPGIVKAGYMLNKVKTQQEEADKLSTNAGETDDSAYPDDGVVSAVSGVFDADGWGNPSEGWNSIFSLVTEASKWDPNYQDTANKRMGLFGLTEQESGTSSTDPAEQARGAERYIKTTYQNPAVALKYFQNHAHKYLGGGLVDDPSADGWDGHMALLAHKEYVMPRSVVEQPGVLGLLDGLRQGDPNTLGLLRPQQLATAAVAGSAAGGGGSSLDQSMTVNMHGVDSNDIVGQLTKFQQKRALSYVGVWRQ